MIIKSIKVVNNYYAGNKEIIKRARTIFLVPMNYLVWEGRLERGGGYEGRQRSSYPVNRVYTCEILLFSYFLWDNESISGPHFSSF
jgi:hypothetical protein